MCYTTYHIQGDCSIEEEDDALNKDWISLRAEDVNFSSYISVDEHYISSMMSSLIVRQQEQ